MDEKINSLQAWGIWVVAALYFAYEMFQLAVFNTISENLQSMFVANAWQFGLLSSAYLFACALFILPAGWSVDRYAVKGVLLIVIGVTVLGIWLLAKTENLGLAILARALTGIGNGFAFLSCMKLISQWFTGKAVTIARGLTYTVGMSGSLIAQMPFKWLVERNNLEIGFMLDGLFGVLLFLLVLCFVKQPSQNKVISLQRNMLQSIKLSITKKQNLLCGIHAASTNTPIILFGALWGNAYLMMRYGISPLQASGITSLIFIGIMMGGPLLGWLVNQVEQRRALMFVVSIAQIVVVLSVAILPLSLSLSAISFLLLGVLGSGQLLAYYVVSESNPLSIEAISLSIVTISINIGGAIIQILFNMLSVIAIGFAAAFYFSACIFAIGLLSLFYIRESYR